MCGHLSRVPVHEIHPNIYKDIHNKYLGVNYDLNAISQVTKITLAIH